MSEEVIDRLIENHCRLEELEIEKKALKKQIGENFMELKFRKLSFPQMKKILQYNKLFGKLEYFSYCEDYIFKQVLEQKCKKKLLEKLSIDINNIYVDIFDISGNIYSYPNNFEFSMTIELENFIKIDYECDAYDLTMGLNNKMTTTFYDGDKKILKMTYKYDGEPFEVSRIFLDKNFKKIKNYYGEKYKYVKKLLDVILYKYVHKIDPFGYNNVEVYYKKLQ